MSKKILQVKDFDKDFTSALTEMEHGFWVFRGHGQVGWQLEPSLGRYLRTHQRNIDSRNHSVREKHSIAKFQKSAYLHLSHLPAKEAHLSWLAVMQHFGSPTRLLDFTYSPIVALYFALMDSASTVEYGANLTTKELEKKFQPYEVHALHIKSIRNQAQKISGSKDPVTKIETAIGRTNHGLGSFVGFFDGDWLNPRQVAQQGLFLVPSKIEMDLDKYLSSCPSESRSFTAPWVVLRFAGGIGLYKEMINRLLRANVTAESLFPGLEGTARSLSMRLYEPKVRLF